MRQILSGEGWRIGWNPDAQFSGFLAGQGWAIELTQQEFQDFCRSAQQLQCTMSAMSEQLMEEERLSCEQETETIWLEAEGFPHQYSLRFILLTGRKGEGEWPAVVVTELLQAVDRLTVVSGSESLKA